MLNFIGILTVVCIWKSIWTGYTLYYIYRQIMLYLNRKDFAFKKESFWSAKGLHLEGKRTPFAW